MKTERVLLDATYGAALKAGDKVRVGRRLGVGLDGEPTESPVSGEIVRIEFDPEAHVFEVLIRVEG